MESTALAENVYVNLPTPDNYNFFCFIKMFFLPFRGAIYKSIFVFHKDLLLEIL